MANIEDIRSLVAGYVVLVVGIIILLYGVFSMIPSELSQESVLVWLIVLVVGVIMVGIGLATITYKQKK